ncbi:MAG: glycosyltransferase [Candidatus Omnitrophica bacterium]|nr:glycosyltransferase [Candidatus Omnitrophota bacterium]
MLKKLFISVIVISNNSERTLLCAVDNVLMADYEDNFEIIIVDDASRIKVENYITANQRIKIIRNNMNKGPAYSRNAGAEIAKGDVLFFIDSDIYVRKDSLSLINSGFEQGEVSALIGHYDAACLYRDFFSNYYNLRLIKASRDLGADYCHAAVYAIRKDVFGKLSGFDTNYARASVEDLEFGRRVFSSGYKANVLDTLTVVHDKKLTFATLLKNDFIRSADRMEFVLNLAAIQNIVRNRRFDHHNIEQLLAIFIIPFFWASIVLSLVSTYFFLLVLLFLPIFIFLNQGYLLFLFEQKGFWFYLKSIGFYIIDLNVIFTGLLAGLFANLVLRVRSRCSGFGYLPYIKYFFVKNFPMEITFFVTNRCNAACGYCFYYRELNVPKRELSLPEIERMFSAFGPLLRVLMSGGEPFLREDLPDIVKAICAHSRPRHITIPTNGIMTDKIIAAVEEMFAYSGDTVINITLSLAELYDKRDRLTGVEGSFNDTLNTYYKLKKLKDRFPHLVVGVNITVTSSNAEHVEQIYDFARDELQADTLAFSLVRDSPMPGEERLIDIEIYKRLVGKTKKEESRLRFPFWRLFVRRRGQVYDYVIKSYTEQRYLLPCYAGKIRVVITPEGDVFPCETFMLTGREDYRLGNLRDCNYDIKQIFRNKKRNEVCTYIKESKCHCRHECDLIANISFNPRFLM